MDPKYPEVTVELVGQDGNAFAIMGAVQKALRKHFREIGMDPVEAKAELDRYMQESMSGDYDALLRTAIAWVNVE